MLHLHQGRLCVDVFKLVLDDVYVDLGGSQVVLKLLPLRLLLDLRKLQLPNLPFQVSNRLRLRSILFFEHLLGLPMGRGNELVNLHT